MGKSKIILKSLQIKSLKKAKKLCSALTIIEEECGIKNVKIILKDIFICGCIDLEKLNTTDMEILIRDIFKKD